MFKKKTDASIRRSKQNSLNPDPDFLPPGSFLNAGTDKAEKFENSEKFEKADAAENSEKFDKFEKFENLEKFEKAESSDAADDSAGTESSVSAGKAEGRSPEEKQNFSQKEALEAAYCLGAGIDEETFAKAKEILNEITMSVTSNQFNPKALQLAIRLLNYEEELEKARKEGRETGRAEKIAEAFRGKRAKADEAASIPHLSGTKDMGTVRSNSIFDVARGV